MAEDKKNTPEKTALTPEEQAAQRKRDVISGLFLFALAGMAFAMPHLMYGGPRYEHMLLVATDKLDSDEHFHDTVIYLTQHGIGGAKGMIVNHPDRLMPYDEIYDMLGVRYKNTEGGIEAYNGGPIKPDKFTFLHTDDVRTKKSKKEGDGLMITHESMEMVRRVSTGEGPAHARFIWGYSGWGPEQLETEMQHGKWVVIKADPDLIFHDPPEEIHDMAILKYEAVQEAKAGTHQSTPPTD